MFMEPLMELPGVYCMPRTVARCKCCHEVSQVIEYDEYVFCMDCVASGEVIKFMNYGTPKKLDLNLC